MAAVVSLVKKVMGGGGISSNFPTHSCKFPTEEIMGAQNFNFAPKFPQNGGLSASNFALLHENFWTKRKLSDRLKFRGWQLLPPPTPLPQRNWTTDYYYFICNVDSSHQKVESFCSTWMTGVWGARWLDVEELMSGRGSSRIWRHRGRSVRSVSATALSKSFWERTENDTYTQTDRQTYRHTHRDGDRLD